MLKMFAFKNFCSFREWTSISMEVNDKVPSSVAKKDGVVFLMGVKGANGSGKTGLLKALSFIAYFIKHSAKENDSSESKDILFDTFFDNNEPAEFYIEFATKENNYIYELSLGKNSVLSEILYKNNKRKTLVFKRELTTVEAKGNNYKTLESLALKNTASILSTAAQLKQSPVEDITEYFKSWLSNVGYAGHRSNVLTVFKAAEILHSDAKFFQFVKDFIKNCDIGVTDIKIERVTRDDGTKNYAPIFIHAHNGKTYKIPHLAESSGTNFLFKNLILYKLAKDRGGLLTLDEFDLYLHPHILPKLLDYFDEDNENGGQFIFTTHNTEILEKLGRYRSYLVNKENNESYGYRLDEVPGEALRNDRAIVPYYNRGDIGGVPKL